jgi:2-polyprenyl-3-methyl-5-hydroxy-6-metoxy-1,4-benzoquinol methylase
MSENQSLFLQAVKKHFKTHVGHPQYQVWLDYVLGTNARGEDVVNTVRSFMPHLTGKRHLDIGCGYGGTCIAFGKAGCTSKGIDISAGLLDLAQQNLADHSNLPVELRQMDSMNWDEVCSLGKFDVITCDNVIEHVSVPERLISQIRLLLNPGGVVYLTIPNAFSVGQIRKDGHYGQFGVSLLDSVDGTRFVKNRIQESVYDVSFYYPFGYYEDQFQKYHLSSQIINRFPDSSDQYLATIKMNVEQLRDDLDRELEKGGLPEDIQLKLRNFIAYYVNRFESDLIYHQSCENSAEKQRFAARIVRDYDTELWYVILLHSSIIPEPPSTNKGRINILRKIYRRLAGYF